MDSEVAFSWHVSQQMKSYSPSSVCLLLACSLFNLPNQIQQDLIQFVCLLGGDTKQKEGRDFFSTYLVRGILGKLRLSKDKKIFKRNTAKAVNEENGEVIPEQFLFS